ncbi:MAG: peptidoglycan DD-metalloendopeptidase family protein [Clostridia bacterium]|nr:peptidoglycan DD-metalloendopeptidase family protein [Clostridia bacterium]
MSTNLPITGSFNITAVYKQVNKRLWATYHKGIDFVASDKRVFSTCDGVVRTVAYDANGWGQYVSIGDAEGRRHIFCHLVKGSVKVKKGDKVTRDTVIGTMGDTGNVTGVHLHYQLQIGDTVVDPCAYLGIPNKIGSYSSKDFQIEEVKIVPFKDYDEVPKWAKDEKIVEKAVELGIVKGDNNGNLCPNDTPTKIEVLAMIVRALK